MVLIDTGGELHGYQADISRTFVFPLGSTPTDEQRAMWQAVKDAQDAALQVKDRRPCQDLSASLGSARRSHTRVWSWAPGDYGQSNAAGWRRGPGGA
jgi:Xaa-Pro dipeptidase